MGTVLGVLVGLVLAGGMAAFIDLVSKDNGRGYQPNKPLEGPQTDKGNCIQNPRRHCAGLPLVLGEKVIGVVIDWEPGRYDCCIRSEYLTEDFRGGELFSVNIKQEGDL